MNSKMPMKKIVPSAKHEAVRDAVLALIREKMADAPAVEILAILSYTVGQLIALQDQRKMTADMAMQLVITNIEAGNLSVLEGLAKESGGSA